MSLTIRDAGRVPRSAAAVRSAGIGFILWSLLTALPWLLPTHAGPWNTFYQEFLMATAVAGAAAWTLLLRRRWKVDVLVVGFLAASLIPPLQAAAGLFAVPEDAPLVSLYLVGFALTLLVARHAEEAAPGRLIEALLAGILIAGLASTGLALYQWLGGDGLGLLAAPIPFRDRPVANVGQPNNLATLMVWGLVAAWWAHLKGRIGSLGAVMAAAFLLIGVTLTQSRSGVLQVVLLGALSVLARQRLRSSGQTIVFAGLAVWLVACIFALEPLTNAWTEQHSRPLLNTDSPRERTMLLWTDWLAIRERPWFGYGWYQNVPAHVAVSDRSVMHGLIANAHNVVLDLVIWNGLPLALLMTGGLCAWYWNAARRAVTPEQTLLLLALATFCVHASLELPHVFAYFLLPVAIIMGTLTAALPLARSLSIPNAVVAVAVLLCTAVLCQMFTEYRRVEANLTDARMRSARIAGARAEWDPDVRILGTLKTWLTVRQFEPRRDMSGRDLADLRRVLTRYPSSFGLLRYAEASVLNGRPADATWALGVLCSVHLEPECQAAASDWATLAADGKPELAVVEVPVDRGMPPRR